MDEVRVEQTSYQMPPTKGFTVAQFITVADNERSVAFYSKVFRGVVVSGGNARHPINRP